MVSLLVGLSVSRSVNWSHRQSVKFVCFNLVLSPFDVRLCLHFFLLNFYLDFYYFCKLIYLPQLHKQNYLDAYVCIHFISIVFYYVVYAKLVAFMKLWFWFWYTGSKKSSYEIMIEGYRNCFFFLLGDWSRYLLKKVLRQSLRKG